MLCSGRSVALSNRPTVTFVGRPPASSALYTRAFDWFDDDRTMSASIRSKSVRLCRARPVDAQIADVVDCPCDPIDLDAPA
jgi:hypothetical protein